MRSQIAAAALLFAFSLLNFHPAHAKKNPPPALEGTGITLRTSEGLKLHGLFSPPTYPELPTFILLHQLGERKETWQPLAQALARKGYGYLAYDARGHGQSRLGPQGEFVHFRNFRSTGTDNEWNRMVEDVDNAFEFLKQRGIEEFQIGIIGASIGANVGLKAAAKHPKVSFTILLSPSLNYRDVRTHHAMSNFGKRPIFFAAALEDEYSHRATQILVKVAKQTAGAENVTWVETPNGHGHSMLNDFLIQNILRFIERPRISPPSP